MDGYIKQYENELETQAFGLKLVLKSILVHGKQEMRDVYHAVKQS